MTLHYLTLFICVVLISLSATGMVLKYLKKKAIFDHPNERSSHSIPTPRGGGIGILIAIFPALFLVQFFTDTPLSGYVPVLICGFGLALLSWLDDLTDLGPAIRFISQIAAVTICLYFMPTPNNGYLGGFIPVWAEKTLLGVGWVWFINLFNFMDGIDGISAVEIITIGTGIILISSLSALPPEYTQAGLIMAAGALGFLKWNWHKAKVFMGDVGSIPIGFLLGWLLILLAGEGLFIPAIIIAGYYLSDATLTLLKRALRKEKIWRAHREHYYQKATQSGMAHDTVVIKITIANLILLISTWLCLTYSIIIGIGLGFAVIGFLLWHFNHSFKANS